jgi:hypothetical protein
LVRRLLLGWTGAVSTRPLVEIELATGTGDANAASAADVGGDGAAAVETGPGAPTTLVLAPAVALGWGLSLGLTEVAGRRPVISSSKRTTPATSSPSMTATAMRRPNRSGATSTVASEEYERAGAGGDGRGLTAVGVSGRSSKTLGTSSFGARSEAGGVCAE